MGLRFMVLASGSAGNACLIETGGFGLLLDAGLGPRQLASRLTAMGASWKDIQAVVLTHTHSDHWNDRTLTHLFHRGLPLYCHPEHHGVLGTYSSGFIALRSAVQSMRSSETIFLCGRPRRGLIAGRGA